MGSIEKSPATKVSRVAKPAKKPWLSPLNSFAAVSKIILSKNDVFWSEANREASLEIKDECGYTLYFKNTYSAFLLDKKRGCRVETTVFTTESWDAGGDQYFVDITGIQII